MKALVTYYSESGNTEKLARAIYEGINLREKEIVSMGDVGLDFLKATGIKQALDPLPRSEFSLGLLSLDSLGTSALADRFPAAEQFSVQIVWVHAGLLK